MWHARALDDIHQSIKGKVLLVELFLLYLTIFPELQWYRETIFKS